MSGTDSTRGRYRIRVGMVLLSVWILAALVVPEVWPDRYDSVNYSVSLSSPSLRHPLGTDALGRDLFVRVMVGARVSLAVAALSRVVALFIGVLLGGWAGFQGRWVDLAVMRVVDVMLAFPTLLLAVALVAIWGANLVVLFVAIGLASWAEIARLMRAQVLVVKELEYSQAALVLGVGRAMLFFRHILPNCLTPVLVWTTTGMAGAILAESGLSFLGLGVEPPLPSWGALIAQGWDEVRRAPWLAFFPGLALAWTVILFNLVGDRLREDLDPRTR
ncbi:MAG: ABC transporter permease [Candidatus Omnitrophica bacterium]|nr:Glutathione transport system permease protein GsiD [bacterium]NUN97082.1 ABC transporter permease [Candidatus Omnitrophota bacterium]